MRGNSIAAGRFARNLVKLIENINYEFAGIVPQRFLLVRNLGGRSP